MMKYEYEIIHALDVIDPEIYDDKVMKKLVEDVLKINHTHKVKIRSVLANGVSDTNNNFKYLEKNRIIPGIKVRSNSVVSFKNNKIRNKEAKIQSKDLLKWKKKKRKYGYRWMMAEIVFSSIKRMFGDIRLPLGFKI